MQNTTATPASNTLEKISVERDNGREGFNHEYLKRIQR